MLIVRNAIYIRTGDGKFHRGVEYEGLLVPSADRARYY